MNYSNLSIFFKCLFIYFERERESEQERESWGGAERENPKQALCYQHRAPCRALSWEPWDHNLSRNQQPDTKPTEPPRLILKPKCVFLIFKNFINVYLFLREQERQSLSGEGAEREGDTESEAESWLRAVTTGLNAALELRNSKIMTWAEVRPLTDRATQVPLFKISFNVYLFLKERETVQKRGRGRGRGRHRI